MDKAEMTKFALTLGNLYHSYFEFKVFPLCVSDMDLFSTPTALTYHYETQCIPTPLAWFAHQLPVWFQKLSVVGTFVIEIAVPFLFFSPIRRHRLTSFYMQVGLVSLSSLQSCLCRLCC